VQKNFGTELADVHPLIRPLGKKRKAKWICARPLTSPKSEEGRVLAGDLEKRKKEDGTLP